jgi:hypothetical protein
MGCAVMADHRPREVQRGQAGLGLAAKAPQLHQEALEVALYRFGVAKPLAKGK